ncbi:DUF3618 domain-containing protein [Brevibacterium samyangense]|uniref:DUF3618 domain-containing protein n=1 Tax=Brevibacterium samyangense TaxID=366888 RepID=A0ABN2TJD9_9MICO
MTSIVYTSDVTVDKASKDQLAESIRLREQRLAANLEELVQRVHPKTLSAQAVEKAKGTVVSPTGELRTTNLALMGGVVLAVTGVALALVLKGRK